MGGPGTSPTPGGPIDSTSFVDVEEQEQKRRALAEPGPSWKEWLYFTAFRWWMGILFLIVDSWIVATFLVIRAWLPLAAATATAIYLEILIYGYFWHRPDPDRPRPEGRFRWPPYQVGRWTPEGFRIRSGQAQLPVGEKSPDPREFL